MSFLMKLSSDYWGMVGLVATAVGGVCAIAQGGVARLAMLAVFAAGLAMLCVHCVRASRASQIVAKGDFVYGAVTNVKINYLTNINTSPSHLGPDDPSVIHPTVLRFAYTYNGQYYEGKSDLMWRAPQYGVGQEIKIYIVTDHPERYAL